MHKKLIYDVKRYTDLYMIKYTVQSNVMTRNFWDEIDSLFNTILCNGTLLIWWNTQFNSKLWWTKFTFDSI